MPETPTPSEQPEKEKKKNRKKQERKFRDTDANYTSKSRSWQRHFTDRLALFTAFNPLFDITYANNWMAKIETCEGLLDDETIVDEMAGIMVKLNQHVVTLITHINALEFYAKRAFKDEPEILYEFQFNKVNRFEQYSLKFIVKVYVIMSLAEVDYNAELLAAGMPPNTLTDLETVLEEVTNHEIYHEKFKSIRIRRTRERIKEMNQLYEINEEVRQAAQVIFFSQPEVAGLFA